MFNIISLLTAAALVSLHSAYHASAQLDNTNADLDNNIQRNTVVSPSKKHLSKFVRILTPPPDSVRHTPGTRFEIKCEALGSPAPTIRWLKNGEHITDYAGESNEIPAVHISSLGRMTSTLILSSADDGDVFTCLAMSEMMQKTASTTVYIVPGDSSEELPTLEKLFSAPAKPRITLYYNDLFQIMGTTAVLPCRVNSYTKSQIYWEDNKHKLVYGNTRLRVLPSGDLMITGLRWSDMGEYTCTVKNVYGKESITTFLYPAKP